MKKILFCKLTPLPRVGGKQKVSAGNLPNNIDSKLAGTSIADIVPASSIHVLVRIFIYQFVNIHLTC